LEGVRPVAVYHEIVARLLTADTPPRVLAEAAEDVLLIPPKAPYAERFMLGVWGAPERDPLMIQAMLGTVRQLGIELHSHSYQDRVLYWSGGFKTASTMLQASNRYATAGEKPRLDSEKLVMYPPLLPSPEAVRATKEAWQKAVRPQFASGAWMVGLDDERRMSADFDFHPQTLAGFRRWLEGRYADVAALNRSWGTSFADF